MAVEQVAVQELPFVVEPIVPARLKLWGRFAGQASTDIDVDILLSVYRAFWWEKQSHVWYDHVSFSHSCFDVSALVRDLNFLANSLGEVAGGWFAIAERCRGFLRLGQGMFLFRYAKDAAQSATFFLSMLQEVRFYGASLCQQYGLAVPEYLVEPSASPTVSAVGEGAESL